MLALPCLVRFLKVEAHDLLQIFKLGNKGFSLLHVFLDSNQGSGLLLIEVKFLKSLVQIVINLLGQILFALSCEVELAQFGEEVNDLSVVEDQILTVIQSSPDNVHSLSKGRVADEIEFVRNLSVSLESNLESDWPLVPCASVLDQDFKGCFREVKN